MLDLFYSGMFMKAKVIRAIAPDHMMKADLNSDCNALCRITAKKRN